MANKSPRTVPYRRVREQKTDYKKRLALLLAGKTRLVVRLTNRRVIGQLVNFGVPGDKVISAIDSFSLHKLGWTHSTLSLPAAYLLGFWLGTTGIAVGCTEAIVDTGLQRPVKKGRIYAFVKGAIDAGLQVPHDPAIFPEEERLQGKHLKYDAAVQWKSAMQKIQSGAHK